MEKVTAAARDGYSKQYHKNIRSQLEIAADLRFSGRSSEAFRILKNLTKYDSGDRRDGGIVSYAYNQKGDLIIGEELHKAIVEDYRSVNCQLSGLPEFYSKFPHFEFSLEEVILMTKNVKAKKAGGLDGVCN
jgi:hypothetical protein